MFDCGFFVNCERTPNWNVSYLNLLTERRGLENKQIWMSPAIPTYCMWYNWIYLLQQCGVEHETLYKGFLIVFFLWIHSLHCWVLCADLTSSLLAKKEFLKDKFSSCSNFNLLNIKIPTTCMKYHKWINLKIRP